MRHWFGRRKFLLLMLHRLRNWCWSHIRFAKAWTNIHHTSVIVCAKHRTAIFIKFVSILNSMSLHLGKNSMNMNSPIRKYLHDLELFIVWWFFSIVLRANLKFYTFCFPILPKKNWPFIWVHCIRFGVSFRYTPSIYTWNGKHYDYKLFKTEQILFVVVVVVRFNYHQ